MVCYWVEYGIFIVMELGDEELLKKYIVDFILFSYYIFLVFVVNLEEYGVIGGNLYSIIKNLNLECIEWGWQFDLIGFCVVFKELYDCY